MDPQFTSLLIGVLSNGLTFLISQILRNSGKLIIGKELLEKIKKNETAIIPILQKTLDNISEEIEWKSQPRLEEICLFLTSPEVETIVRQIYATKLTTDRSSKNLKLIKKEFLTSFSIYFDSPIEKIENSATLLFKIIIEGCEVSLELAIDKGILSAHEAKSAFRHQILLDELDSIKKNIEFFTSVYKPNIKDFLEFEEKYRKQVGNRHSYIIPPHFDTVRRIFINDLYVPSNFLTIPKKKDKESIKLNLTQFLSCIYRVVILGNPGSGKSTFTHKLCYDLAQNYSKRIFSGREVTPILVILREYGAEKKDNKCSIVQFIEKTSCSRYQVHPPEGAFEYLLYSGRVIIIFDGLDELLDTSYRQEISADVESFCKLYPSVPAIVTSREVGYEQAPLIEKNFEIFRISDFSEEQVKEYSEKWFSIDIDFTPDQKKQKAESFYEESKIVPDLRANPLMLALMCNIYRGENYIPRNRPDVYEKCAIMLFERWDKSRGIHVTLPFEAHIKPAMMYLAHWIYSNESLQGGVTEQYLIKKSTDYLCPKRFEDRDEAEMAAREFIDFCRGRAWVFTDTGTTKEGERLYQFTHRTFLEYFTGSHLVRNNPTPKKLTRVLLPKIAKREWDVVAQLAFQLQNKNVEGAGDELLISLIDEAKKNKVNSINYLSFAVRCLEFLVPSPRITRIITTETIEKIESLRVKKTSKGEEREYSSEVLGDLQNSLSENRSTIADCIKKIIDYNVKSDDENMAILFLEMGLNLEFPLFKVQRRYNIQGEIFNFWENLSKEIVNLYKDQINLFSQKHFKICHMSFFKNVLSLEYVINSHGLESLFWDSFNDFYNCKYISIAFSLLFFISRFPYYLDEGNKYEKVFENLNYLGNYFLNLKSPFLKVLNLDREIEFLFDDLRYTHLKSKNLEIESYCLESDTLFGAFILLAVLSECKKNNKYLKLIKETEIYFFNFIRWVLIARFEKVDENKVQEEFEKCKYNDKHKSLIWKWINKEINFKK